MGRDGFDLDRALDHAETGNDFKRLEIRALWKIAEALESVAFAITHTFDETGHINLRASVTVEKDDWSISE